MYICSCHAVTDGAIRASIKSGTKTFAELAKKTGIATQCGICGRQAKELFYKIREEETGVGKPAYMAPANPVTEDAQDKPSCAATPCGRAGGCQGCPALHDHKPRK